MSVSAGETLVRRLAGNALDSGTWEGGGVGSDGTHNAKWLATRTAGSTPADLTALLSRASILYMYIKI